MEDKAPSELSDEELDKMIQGEEQEDVESPESEEPENPQNEEEDKEEQPEPEDTPVEEEQEEERPPSRREQLRIQNLLTKYPDLEKRATQAQSGQKPVQALNYREELETDDETAQRLEQDRQGYGDARYQEGINTTQQQIKEQIDYSRWETRLLIDSPKVEKAFPILDKTSEDYHPAVQKAVDTMYLRHVGYNPETQTVTHPDVSYAEFVEANMELVEEIAGVMNQKTVKNVAKQAAHTGLRPDGSSAKRLDLNKAPHQMSDEELDAYGKSIGLNTVKPRN